MAALNNTAAMLKADTILQPDAIEKLYAEVEIASPDGKKSIEMLLKQRDEIRDCKEGMVVCLNLRNGETLTGIFAGMDDNYIKLASLSSKYVLGYQVSWLTNYYFEQVVTPAK